MTVQSPNPDVAGPAQSRKPHVIDLAVGARLRARRNMLGLSQTQVGDSLGVTFQQIQKYEKGVNRVGASRLYQFAEILGVPVGYFFADFSSPYEDMPPPGDELLTEKYEIALNRAWRGIASHRQRLALLDLAEALAHDAAHEAAATRRLAAETAGDVARLRGLAS